MGLLTTSAPKRGQMMPNTAVYTENTTLPNIEFIQEESLYLLIPLGALLAIIILSLLVYLMASNRRRLLYMYCKNGQRSRFIQESNEYDSLLQQGFDTEEEEDEIGHEDNPAKYLLTGKLQISNRFESYLSTSQLNRSSELFT